jgi:CBS domain-containing protein
MPIERLIRRPVKTLPPDATCEEAAKLMRDENIGAVVVADEAKPLGVVTDRDLVVRVIAAGEPPEKVQLRDVMSGEPIFLGDKRSLDQAIAAMRDRAIRRLPIIDAEGQLEGLVSMDDLLVLLIDQLSGLAQAVRKEIEPPA